MLGIGFGRKDRGGRMKRGLGRLSGSTQIDLFDVFATLSKAIGILDRLDNDKQRILVGNAAVERLDSSVNILDDEFNAAGASRPPSSCRLLPRHRWHTGCNRHPAHASKTWRPGRESIGNRPS